jgi:hypothetical protein
METSPPKVRKNLLGKANYKKRAENQNFGNPLILKGIVGRTGMWMFSNIAEMIK